MKKAAVLLFLLAVAAGGASPVGAAGKADEGFEKLKALVGQWQGKAPDGSPVTVAYELVSGGHTLMEHLSFGDMITMYHVDGGHLMLTHYCEGNNQPRMRSEGFAPDGQSLQFRFFDATNLAKPTDPHMMGLKVTFKDGNHITQQWTDLNEGKESHMVLELERKK
jgi:hypothetical protein